MASGAVRELITKIKIELDKASVSAAGKALQDLKQKVNDVSGENARVKVATDGVKAVNKELQDVKKTVADIAKTNAKVKVTDNGASKISKTLQDLKRKLNDLGRSATNVKVNADGSRAQSVLQRIKGELNTLQGKTTTAYVEVKQKGKKVGEGVKKTGQALADNGGTIAATGAAMVAPLALPANIAMDFEAAMSKVKAITNSTDADMEKLTQTARDLGASTQFSASEAAAAMSYLGMAGWKTEQIISGMPGLLDLAAASGEDLARVADIVSDDLTAFGMSADKAGHFADVLAAASTNANTNVSMMGETFKYVGAIAGAQKYSIEDMSLATGVLANNGIKGEQAHTSLRSIITRLVKPTNESGTAMDMLGISVANADGTMKPFRQVIADLRKGFNGLTDSQKAEYAAMIAGQEAMSGLLSLVNTSDADLQKLTSAVDNSNGAAHNMALIMNDNAKGALKALKSALEEVAITIGNTFLGQISGATKKITEFARSFGEFAKEHPKLIAGVTAFVAIAGTLLVILGGLGLALSGVGAAVSALAPIFAALSATLSGVIALFSSWGTLFAGLFGGIGAVLSGALTAITGFIGSFITGVSTMFSGGLIGVLTSAFRGAVSLIMGLFSPINVAIMAVIGVILLLQEHWDDVVAWFAPGIESMKEGLAQLASAWENIAPIVDALMPLLKNIAVLCGSVIVGAVSFLWRAFSAAFNLIAGVINWVTGLLNDLAGTIRWVADGINGLIDKAKNFIGLKSSIDGVNTSITQKWADNAMAGGGSTVTQNNNYVFDTPKQYEPVARTNFQLISDFQ